MGTPILTKKQLKSTLSAKKNKPKETLKNVLAIPYNTIYWPEITSEDHQSIYDIITKNLPRLKNEPVYINWDKIKHVPKSERKTYRKELIQNISGQDQIINKKTGVCLGVNAVTNLLEKNLVSAILITANVQPRLMVQHILDQAVLYRVPILIFDKLKSILKTHCGIGSIAFAIERNIPPDSNLNLIRESIEKVYKKCPVPENHINYHRSVNCFKPNLSKEDQPLKTKETMKLDENEIRKNIYLKKPSSGRAFVPSDPKQIPLNKKALTMEVDETGFIPFTEVSSEEQGRKRTQKYNSLVVKRLKSDKNRNKKKIQSLKGK